MSRVYPGTTLAPQTANLYKLRSEPSNCAETPVMMPAELRLK